ncbi:MAG: DNA repair protein RadA [bacterium JZ-2024 1]
MNPSPRFICSQCGAYFTRWMGKCPNCEVFGTIEEITLPPGSSSSPTAFSRPISTITIQSATPIALSSTEWNRVLGRGLLPGSVILLAGNPGVGKSTLLLQIAEDFATITEKTVLYISGEENPEQIKLRAERLSIGSPHVYLLSTSSLETALAEARLLNPGLVIVDSIQALRRSEEPSWAGSIAQVRDVAESFTTFAKESSRPVILVGHITKEGAIAGPKYVEHLVDVVLSLEGEADLPFRYLRSLKNRFGATGEIGIFCLTEEGFQDVRTPAHYLLSHQEGKRTGTAISIIREGSLYLPVEMQALVVPTKTSLPRRTSMGIHPNRLAVLLGILEKYCRIYTSDRDVFFNVVGGMHISDPASDLAACVAIASSFWEKEHRDGAFFMGEVSLTGDVLPVPHLEARLREAGKLGLKIGFLGGKLPQKVQPPCEIVEISDIKTAFPIIFRKAVTSQ